MAKKKLYEVRLVSRSVQTKYVLATSKSSAIDLANQDEWDEKEEMLESQTSALLKDGPDHPSNYVRFVNDEGDLDCDRYVNVVK